MKKQLLAILAAFLFFVPQLKAQSGNNVFAGTQVFTINLQFSQPGYWDSLTTYYNQGNEQYIMCSATVNGVVYDSVGARLKGNSTYSHPNNKKPFKISFDEYKDQLWDGMKSATLNNCYLDPTFMREKMHADFCRDAGIVAPRCNYVSLYINGTLWGLYSMVESVDKKFLKTKFNNNNGNLFKAVDAFGSTSNIISDLKWYGSTQSSYANRYELKTNEEQNDWTDLIALIDTINNNPNTATALSSIMNLPAYYKTLAADILFANTDAYVGSGRNYHVYHLPTTNKFEWIIWDVSLSFGAYPGGSGTAENLGVTYVSNATNRPLIGKIYNTPVLKDAYLSALCQLFGTYFSSARLSPKIDSIANIIRPYVQADTKKQYTTAQFETNLNSDIISGGRIPGLKSFITLRQASVQTQLANLGYGNCVLSGVTGNEITTPETYSLSQNFPNPFNPSTVINYEVPKNSIVTIKVYNTIGKEVAVLVNKQSMNAGRYSVTFDGANLSSGVYFYSMETAGFKNVKKMILIK